MPDYKPVTPERHRGKHWRWLGNYGFASKDMVAPIAGAELAAALAAMPIAFIKHDGGYSLVVVTSVVPGQNLFVGPQGQWLGTYVPAIYRSYPFQLLRPESSGQAVLCIDEASGALADGDGKAESPFYLPDGGLSPSLQSMMSYLSQLEQSKTPADIGLNALDKAGVISPWPISVKTASGQERPLEGLHRVNEEALNKLDEHALLRLWKASALPIAYAQMFSMSRLTVFEQLVQLQDKLRKDQAPAYQLPLRPSLSSELILDAAALARLKERQ